MICPNHNGPMCTTCLLGGLIRCPVLGVPLPLVEQERRISRKATRVLAWPLGLPEAEKERVLRYMREHGYFE